MRQPRTGWSVGGGTSWRASAGARAALGDGGRDEEARWSLWPVLAALAACWLVLSWPWLSGRVTIPWDAKAHFLPQMQFLAQSLARGDSPAWAPYVFSGHPQIADPQSLIFSPPFLALAMVDGNPGLRAADAALLAMVLLGSGCLLVWGRDRGWHWSAGLISALAFGFGAAMAWRIQHIGQVLSCVYLVVTLLLLARALERRSVTYGFLAGISGGLMLLGRDQVALLGAYLLIGYVAWQMLGPDGAARRDSLLQRLRHALAPLSAGVVGGVVVVAVPLLLTALIAAESNRPAIDLEGAGRGSLHPALLLTMIAPDLFGAAGRMEDYWGPPSFAWQGTGLFIAQNVGILYVGALPLLLLLGGAASGRLWDREIRFFSVATALLLVYALGWYTPLFAPMHKLLPGVDLFRRPADAVFIIGLLLAVLTGHVADGVLSGRAGGLGRWPVLLAGAALLAALAAAVVVGLRMDRLGMAALPLAVAVASLCVAALALAAAVWLRPIRPLLAGALPVLALVADLGWSNGPTTSSAMPSSYYEVLQPDTRNETIRTLKRLVDSTASETRRDRVELVGLGFHWPNASLTHGLENTLGYNPLRLGLYSRATGAEDHVGLPDQRKFSPLFPSYRSMLADLLGLRFIAAGAPIETIDKTLGGGGLALVARTGEAWIYENLGALPRVVFATGAAPADFDDLLARGAWPAFDPRSTVLVEPRAAVGTAARRPGEVRIVRYRNTEVTIAVDSPDGGFVVLNDVWHPWWSADIAGRKVEVLRANVLFRAVEVPAGAHVVRFQFRPLGALRDELLRGWLRQGVQAPRADPGTR